MNATVVAAALGVLSTVGAVLITGWLNRKQNNAITEKVTAEAHALIYKEYATLISAQRTDAQVAREHAYAAEGKARDAERRADAAEEMAYRADERMKAMESLLLLMRPFLVHVQGSEDFVAQIDRLTAARADRSVA